MLADIPGCEYTKDSANDSANCGTSESDSCCYPGIRSNCHGHTIGYRTKTDRTFHELIAQSKGLLLDFDGPVCDVFAGISAARIARDLASAFDRDIQTDDPLDLIREAIRVNGPVDEIHDALTHAEVEAVATATETPGIRNLILRYHGPIAVVSNNATEAVDTWLRSSGLRKQIDVIVGRIPSKMKPDPTPLVTAAGAINLPTNGCVFLGDSLSDIEASTPIGCTMIALANSPAKRQEFEQVSDAFIIESIASG